jgi:hypothetical protein
MSRSKQLYLFNQVNPDIPSNYKPIQLKLLKACTILTKMEFFWFSTYFLMFFQIVGLFANHFQTTKTLRFFLSYVSFVLSLFRDVGTALSWPVHLVWMTARLQQDTFLSWHLAPASEVAGGHTLPFKKRHGLPILKW